MSKNLKKGAKKLEKKRQRWVTHLKIGLEESLINALKVEVDFKINIHDSEIGEAEDAKYEIKGEVNDLLPRSVSP